MSSRIAGRIGAIVALGGAGLVLAGATGWGARGGSTSGKTAHRSGRLNRT